MTQAHTGIQVDFLWITQRFRTIAVSYQLGTFGAGVFTSMLQATRRRSRTFATQETDVISERKHCSRRRRHTQVDFMKRRKCADNRTETLARCQKAKTLERKFDLWPALADQEYVRMVAPQSEPRKKVANFCVYLRASEQLNTLLQTVGLYCGCLGLLFEYPFPGKVWSDLGEEEPISPIRWTTQFVRVRRTSDLNNPT